MTDESARIADDIEGYLREHEQKELLRFVAVGSVDDGKSTLIGRLLHDTRGVYEDQLAAVKKASARSAEEIDFSLFTDGLRAEREQGITIDVAYRYFSTAKRKFIIADTPGHVQYTRNMATGASTADAAVTLLDARLGVLPQSRRHAYIASLLGIPHLVCAVNKMDLVGYDRAVFDRLRADFGAYAAALGFADVRFIPISATKGDNVVARSERTPWYEGPTLLEHLETVPIVRDREAEALRFPVQYVLRPHLDYRGFAGQLASGAVRPGDEVEVLPSRRRTRVRAVDTYEGELARAFAPMSVTLRLEDEVDISRGDMVVHAGELPRVVERFEAHLVWMSERPLDARRSYLLKHTTRVVPARVERVAWRTDPETLAPGATEVLALNDIGRVTVRASRPLFCDPYVKNRTTGAFILIDALTNDTVAAGMILDAEPPPLAGEAEGAASRSRVSAAERRARVGHGAAVVWVEAPDAGRAAALGAAIERALFDRGVLATLVAGPARLAMEGALRCADAGLVVVCAAEGASAEARDAVRLHLGEDAFVAATADDASDADATGERVADELAARGVLAGR